MNDPLQFVEQLLGAADAEGRDQHRHLIGRLIARWWHSHLPGAIPQRQSHQRQQSRHAQHNGAQETVIDKLREIAEKNGLEGIVLV